MHTVVTVIHNWAELSTVMPIKLQLSAAATVIHIHHMCWLYLWIFSGKISMDSSNKEVKHKSSCTSTTTENKCL